MGVLKSGGCVDIDESLKRGGDIHQSVSFFLFVQNLRRFGLSKLPISMCDSHSINLLLKYVTLISFDRSDFV